MSQKPKILVIVGPTASGKSDLAVELAREFDGEIISADSRQVYRGMDIGTGKITGREMRGIPHYLLDVADPRRTYSVARYQRDANRAIDRIQAKGKLPIICGGTGLYVQALVDDLALPEVKPNQKLRKELEKKSVAELAKILKKLDARRWREIDRQNPRRLVRAIEIASALGKVPSLKRAKQAKYDFIQIGIRIDFDKLGEKIHRRLIKRLKSGMVAEIKRLHDQGVSWKRLDDFGLEYRFVSRYLRGLMSKEEMIVQLETAIRQYAKRQMTWLKRDRRIQWISGLDQARKIVIRQRPPRQH